MSLARVVSLVSINPSTFYFVGPCNSGFVEDFSDYIDVTLERQLVQSCDDLFVGMFAAASRPGKRKAAPSADRAGKRPRYSGNKTTPSAGRSEKRPRYSGNKTTPSAGRSEKRPERTRGGETSRASKHAKGGFTGRKAPPGGAGKRWEKRTASGQQDKDGGRRQEKRKPQTEMEKIAKYKLKKKKLAAKKALRRPKGRKQR